MKSRVKFAIVVDVETGGLPSKKKQAFYDVALTEVALVAIDLEKLEIVEECSWLVELDYFEGLEYHQKALEVTGITKEALAEKGLPIEDIHRKVRSFIQKRGKGFGKPILVGHNVFKFDAPFFKNLFTHFEDDFEEYIASYEDTMTWGGLRYKESKNYKLGTICQNVGVELTDAHRARTDTQANAEMFIEMVKYLRSSGQQGNEKSLREKFKLDVQYEF